MKTKMKSTCAYALFICIGLLLSYCDNNDKKKQTQEEFMRNISGVWQDITFTGFNHTIDFRGEIKMYNRLQLVFKSYDPDNLTLCMSFADTNYRNKCFYFRQVWSDENKGFTLVVEDPGQSGAMQFGFVRKLDN